MSQKTKFADEGCTSCFNPDLHNCILRAHRNNLFYFFHMTQILLNQTSFQDGHQMQVMFYSVLVDQWP